MAKHVRLRRAALVRFFTRDRETFDKAKDIIDRKDGDAFSGRFYHFLVTKWAIDNPVNEIVQHKDCRTDVVFNIHDSYKRALKSRKVEWFGMYNRKKSGNTGGVTIEMDGERIESTITVLNFVRWLIEDNIPAIARIHRDDILACKRRHSDALRKRAVSPKAQ